jgi:uncharacterized protein (DUF433 family)
VSFVALLAKEGASVDDLAYQFTLTKEQVLAILLYYRLHQSAIDHQDALDTEESRRLHERYGGQPGEK